MTARAHRPAATAPERAAGSFDALLKARVESALADPAPSVPHEQVFAELRAYHAERTKRKAPIGT